MSITGKVSNMCVYGVVTKSDARLNRVKFVLTIGTPLVNDNLTDNMYFSASQAAIWAALGEVQIAANSS